MKHIRINVTDDSGKVLDSLRTEELPEKKQNAEDIGDRVADMAYDAWVRLNEEEE